MVDIKKLKKNFEGRILSDFPLSKITSFGVGGLAELLVYPNNEKDLLTVLDFARERALPVNIIGRGTNLLVRDNGLRGLVIIIENGFKNIKINRDSIYVEAGISLSFLSKILMEKEISGFEFAWGIPGSVGGAIIMNAGAFGSCISDYLKEVAVVTLDGKKKIYKREDMKFLYRKSNLQEKEEIIVSALFEIKKRDSSGEILRRMKEIERIRRKTQPIGEKTAGSIFKNPKGDYAGRIIEKVGLKGKRIGGAVVSKIHANFIVNRGDAKARDIENLIIYIEERVKEKTGIKLVREVKILGSKD